jgi:hypothetical protein
LKVATFEQQVTRIQTIARSRFALVLAGAVLLLLPSTAIAQTADTGAPSPGTPQANQYEIPVQAGRHDAAPPKDQGSSGGGSLYRSDNNFGSSSVVPGDPGGGGGGGGPAGGAGASGGGGSAAGAVGPGATAAGAAAASGHNVLDTGSPSTSAAFTTLPLIIALGILIGIVGVRMRRRAEI